MMRHPSTWWIFIIIFLEFLFPKFVKAISYQDRTKNHLFQVTNSSGNGTLYGNFPEIELKALEALYFSANGVNWAWLNTPNAGTIWNFQDPYVNPCIEKWQGIYCIYLPASNESVVYSLILNEYNLTGTIPDSISNLHNMTLLNLENNNLFGNIPASLFNLPYLTELILDGNRLIGNLPNNITSNLMLLSLEYNRLTGSLPIILGNLRFLQFLLLSNNNFSQEVPISIYSNSLLIELDLRWNAFIGTIPIDLRNLTSLQSIQLAHNKLYGPLPSYFPSNIRVIDFSYNLFTGKLEKTAFQQCNHLNRLELEYNSLNGELTYEHFQFVDSLFQLNLGNNFFNGNPFSSLNLQDDDDDDDNNNNINNNRLSMLIQDGRIDEVSNDGIVVPIRNETWYISLIVFDLSNNLFTGLLPTFPTEDIIYYQVNNNYFSGPVNKQLTTSNILESFDIGNNYVTGTIGFNHSYPSFLNISYNLFTGNIQNLFYPNVNLSILPASSSVYGIILGHNFFTGTIPQYFLHFPALSILDVNNNQLTGTLPNFQNASALAILIASTNCFHGSIPLTLCEHPHDLLPSHRKQLQVIILDGLSSSINCQVPLFSQLLNIHGSFSLKHYISNGFPTCLLQLSVLQILQLSGNGLTGEIKDNSIPYISSTLTNLDLSHNLLSGTIPNHIQNRYWESLDLSYNSFSGELSSSFYNNTLSEDSVINNHDDDDEDDDTGINNNDNNGEGIPDSTTASIYLNVNHLSGMIPSTILKAETINILDGNMFTCNLNRQKYLPLHDPKYHSYTCGSDLVDLSLFFWCGLVVVLLCIGMILMIFWNRFHSNGNEEIKEKNIFHYICWIVSYPFVSMKYSIEIISFWYFYFHHYCQENQQEQQEKEKQMKGTNNNFSMNSILLVQSFHEKVNKISFSICCCIFFIFLPMFSTLTVYYSTYTYKYAWTISGLFLSGYETGIILSICMFLFFLYISGLIITNWIVQITWKPYLKITYDPRIFRIPKKRKKRSRNKLRKLLILRQQQQQQQQLLRQSQHQQQDQGVAKTRLISIESTRSDNRFRRTNRLRSDTAGPRDDRIRSNTSNIPYEITEEQRKREEKKEFIEKLLKVLIYFIVFIINLIVMINADITYVIVIVNDSTSLTILAEIALAILKIFWNNFFLWKILSFVRKRIMIRYWKYYFLSPSAVNHIDKNRTETLHSTDNNNHNSNLNSNEINLFDLQKLENEEEFHAHQSKLLHFKELDVSFISLNIGLNNFLYPIIAIMIVSTRCLYNAIFPAPEVSTLFTSNGTIIGFPVTSQSSYDPPFTYSYQCSSVIYAYYCPVFIIMLILEAFIMPIVKLRVRLWMDTKYRENPEILRNIQKMKNEQNNNQWTSSSPSSSSPITKKEENPKNPIRNSVVPSSSASSLLNGVIPPTNSIITADSARGRGKSFTNRLRSISSSTRDRENSSATSIDIEMKDFSFSTSPSLRKQEDSFNQNDKKETINHPTATNSQQGEGQHHSTFADSFHYYLWTSWFPINSTTSPSSSSSGSQQIPILFDKDRYVVRLNSYLLILVVYGTIFPPLAILACIAIYSHTFFTTILLGRLLSISTILTTTNPSPPVPAVQSSSPNAEGLTGKIKRIFFIPMKFIQFPSSSSSLIHSFEKLSFLLTLKNNISIYQPFQWYEQQLMNDCQGLMIPLKYTLLVLLSIAMFLFGFLIFDILGRTVNPRKASIPGFIFACYTTCLIYFSFRLYRLRPKNGGPQPMEKPSRSSSLRPPPPHSSGSRKWTKENLGQEENDVEENKNNNQNKKTRSIVVDNNGNDHQDNVDGHENDDDDYDENNDHYYEEYDDDDAEDEGDDDEEEGDLTIKTFEFRFTGFWSAASSSFSSNRGPSLFGRRTTGGNRPSENNNHPQIALNPMQQPSAVTAGSTVVDGEEDK